MIWNQWYAVLESNEIPRDRAVGVTRLGEKLCFFRTTDNKIVCLRDKCAHRGAELSIGEICGARGERIACPFHGLEYDATGRCQVIPANGRNTPVPPNFKVHAYLARDAHGLIWIWYGDPREQLPPLPFFEDIDEKFSYATFVDHWPVHYTRAIENQLDVVHLPFVHYNTIGKGGETLVDGPVYRAEEDHEGFRAYTMNRKDDGTPALKPEEITDLGQNSTYLHFRFPNIWQLHFAGKARIFLAFVPVDESNTCIYMRFYQRMVNIPGLRWLVNKIGIAFSKIILRQDKRVVITQQPIKSELKMGENLIQGDLPIIKYRQRRQALKEGNPVPLDA